MPSDCEESTELRVRKLEFTFQFSTWPWSALGKLLALSGPWFSSYGIWTSLCLGSHSPSQASAIHEPWSSRCLSWFQKRQRNQRSNCQHLLDHWKSKSSRKTSTSALLTMPKPVTVWITINCGKFWKRWEYQTTWPASWDICMQVRKQQLELDMQQQTGSK